MSACSAATAALANRQKPIARSGSAWWPGGRSPQKPVGAVPSSSASTRAQAAPAARRPASHEAGTTGVSASRARRRLAVLAHRLHVLGRDAPPAAAPRWHAAPRARPSPASRGCPSAPPARGCARGARGAGRCRGPGSRGGAGRAETAMALRYPGSLDDGPARRPQTPVRRHDRGGRRCRGAVLRAGGGRRRRVGGAGLAHAAGRLGQLLGPGRHRRRAGGGRQRRAPRRRTPSPPAAASPAPAPWTCCAATRPTASATWSAWACASTPTATARWRWAWRAATRRGGSCTPAARPRAGGSPASCPRWPPATSACACWRTPPPRRCWCRTAAASAWPRARRPGR